MDVAKPSAADGREEVVFFCDRETGLRGITVLDDVTLGPPVGACRSRPYDDEERALADALRQARKTTLKAVAAGLPVSGGCTVLLNDAKGGCAGSSWRALGRVIEDLAGRYHLMPDIGDSTTDMDQVAEETDHVLGRSGARYGDPADATARGVQRAIEVAVRHRLGRDGLSGVRVAVMGLGPAGYRLAELLRQQGARLTVADRDPRRTERAVRELGISCVTTEEIVHLDTDVFAPCASKDIINDDTLAHLRCQIVAGTADDPLQRPVHGRGLHERGILYAPDSFVAAGGLISLVQSLLPTSVDRPSIEKQIAAIGDRLAALIDRASRQNIPTSEAAEQMIEALMAGRDSAEDPKAFALAG